MKYSDEEIRILNEKRKEVEILKADNCTQFDAIKHLKNGTIIYESAGDYVESVKELFLNDKEGEQDFLNDENVKTWKEYEENVKKGICVSSDISSVKYDGHLYIVEYFL